MLGICSLCISTVGGKPVFKFKKLKVLVEDTPDRVSEISITALRSQQQVVNLTAVEKKTVAAQLVVL